MLIARKSLENLIGLSHDIYSRLGDDYSRFVFSKRFNYSLSGDVRYIKDLVKSTEIGLSFAEHMEGNKKFFIFGAGMMGRNTLKIWGDSCIGFIDNNKDIQGHEISGRRIYSIEEAKIFGGGRDNHCQLYLSQRNKKTIAGKWH